MGYAVRFEDVSKRYSRGRSRYASLREDLDRGLGRLGSRRRGGPLESPGPLALENISFEVEEGESFALVGPNGAGKTTALKIISRISYPTSGRVKVRGRVGALIEVGSGVHPELTARENIWLYGQILGMSKTDVRRRFDEIVEFAGLALALDIPVKRYSSGMQLRLGFSIASHLDPDVLLVDEALAVGDAAFQRKCVARLREVAGRGTVIFVSHDMTAIRTVCSRALLLVGGRKGAEGSVASVIDSYLVSEQPEVDTSSPQTELFIVRNVSMCSAEGAPVAPFGGARLTVCLEARRAVTDPGVYAGILSISGHRIAGLDFRDLDTPPAMARGERRDFEFEIDSLPPLPGDYWLELHVKDMRSSRIEVVPRHFPLHVTYAPVYGLRKLDGWFGDVGLLATARSRPCVDDPVGSCMDASE